MICEIEIKNGAQIEKIKPAAAKAPYEVWLSSGTVMLDARSLLGLFALIGKKAHVVAEDNVDPRAFSNAGFQNGLEKTASALCGGGFMFL